MGLKYEEYLDLINPSPVINPLEEKVWNIEEFSGMNLPVVVGQLRNSQLFSKRSGVRVLDMALHMPGQGWRIPDVVKQFHEPLMYAMIHESMITGKDRFPNLYCYVTIDQKEVEPGKTQRRPGFHSDAFIVDEKGEQLDVVSENEDAIMAVEGDLVERTYVVYDCLPTAFLPGPFILDKPDDCDHVLQHFDEAAKKRVTFTYPIGTLLCLDPYCVHASTENRSKVPLKRTFMKIQFSENKYNREGNTINDIFDYSGWEWVERDLNKREHRHAVSSSS